MYTSSTRRTQQTDESSARKMTSEIPLPLTDEEQMAVDHPITAEAGRSPVTALPLRLCLASFLSARRPLWDAALSKMAPMALALLMPTALTAITASMVVANSVALAHTELTRDHLHVANIVDHVVMLADRIVGTENRIADAEENQGRRPAPAGPNASSPLGDGYAQLARPPRIRNPNYRGLRASLYEPVLEELEAVQERLEPYHSEPGSSTVVQSPVYQADRPANAMPWSNSIEPSIQAAIANAAMRRDAPPAHVPAAPVHEESVYGSSPPSQPSRELSYATGRFSPPVGRESARGSVPPSFPATQNSAHGSASSAASSQETLHGRRRKRSESSSPERRPCLLSPPSICDRGHRRRCLYRSRQIVDDETEEDTPESQTEGDPSPFQWRESGQGIASLPISSPLAWSGYWGLAGRPLTFEDGGENGSGSALAWFIIYFVR
ncbi:hypothetical protein B0H63DRAFT_451295 [Podospora didyma]|uniref:Uncharacterized protein n=1 Tax=Podospora didyma TaxID=330526 RepID=A0AAE0NIB5_9PEZI|nr:hypothetical protein B0H63DRAFT_451295 [Podospora didyma]